MYFSNGADQFYLNVLLGFDTSEKWRFHKVRTDYCGFDSFSAIYLHVRKNIYSVYKKINSGCVLYLRPIPCGGIRRSQQPQILRHSNQRDGSNPTDQPNWRW